MGLFDLWLGFTFWNWLCLPLYCSSSKRYVHYLYDIKLGFSTSFRWSKAEDKQSLKVGKESAASAYTFPSITISSYSMCECLRWGGESSSWVETYHPSCKLRRSPRIYTYIYLSLHVIVYSPSHSLMYTHTPTCTCYHRSSVGPEPLHQVIQHWKKGFGITERYWWRANSIEKNIRDRPSSLLLFATIII